MSPSRRAEYLRVKRDSPALGVSSAESAELAELESRGHTRPGKLRTSTSASTPIATTRRPDPAPISGEIVVE